ncbi:hypothetical protein N0V93_000254 [Gnomoniopsis smithogilvyi]|uniref:Uncharacterized protein n=1 Tax=Gnomoniopsis smithogilvyi TaxID=1191159 RepID=A0A9W8Z1K2_9PEZI|nr:hypothetical protein N0V93_000254 [Gnomoniopsis smithogilvyi]
MISLDFSRIPDLGLDRKGKEWFEGGEVRMVKYFNELRDHGHDEIAICQALTEAVEQGRLQPYVFSVFLPWCKEVYHVLSLCMVCKFNSAIRSAAIKDLGRRIKKPDKPDNSTSLSHILGDTQSLLDIFAQSSVTDVKHLCVAIRNSGRHGCQRQPTFNERQEAVERLLRALLPAVYPSEPLSCHDKRPIQHLYATMLPACPTQFVEAVLDARDQSNPLFRWRSASHLMRHHRALLKKRAEQHLQGLSSRVDPDVHCYIGTFLKQDKKFALSVLYNRHDGTITDQRWGTHSEVEIALNLVQHLVKRRHESTKSVAVQIRALVHHGLEIQAKKAQATRSTVRCHAAVELWKFALHGWRKWPEIFEDDLVLGLQLGLGSSTHTVPRDYLSAATRPGFHADRRPRLLQLYCRQFGNEGFDIFAEDANLSGLAKISWPHEVFAHLDVDQSTRILKKLEAVNQDYNFLLTPSNGNSIFGCREVPGQKNFNVELLLTHLRRNDPEVRQRARDAVDGLRKKAAAAREQADRADFAEAAALYAIAAGQIDLYGETVLWQQRFVRDPLTMRRLLGSCVVLTKEGIELLSALQTPHDSCQEISSVTIRKADDVLKTFYETYRLAKREPSFQQPAWVHVRSLASAVYTKRVQHLRTLRDAEKNAVAWRGFLEATEWMEVETLNTIYSPIMDLLGELSPAHLSSATQELLLVGAERRKKQKRTSKDDLLERISYEALACLARSSTPNLASDLVVQTIMDRPDASSWHRKLLSTRLLKRLRAEEAHDTLISLAKAIGDRLEEQSYVRIGETEPAVHAPPSSLVKVTTVKYLAQLLNNAEFIPNETAVEVLVELLKNAHHRDIRLAVVESLLGLLDRLCTEAKAEWAATPAVETIMAALETIVPVIGSINESRPPRDEDWAEAKATDVLPEITESQLPPLMDVLLSAPVSTRYHGLKVMKTTFVERLLLPILRQSQLEHGRWIRLFLAKYRAPFTQNDVPVTPVDESAWNRALASYYPLIAPAVLADFDAYAVHKIIPDARVEQFSAALGADVELRKRGEVQHWIRIFGCRDESFAQTGTMTLLGVLQTKYDENPSGEYESVIDIILQHANIFLDHYEELSKIWEGFMKRLAPDWVGVWDAEKYRVWRDTRGRIVRQISDEVRKRQAQKTHQILPSRTKLELWLLPFPALHGQNDSPDFVARLEDVVLELLDSSGSRILDWSDIANDVRTVSGLLEVDELKSKVACAFGKLTDDKDMAARKGNVRVQTRRVLDLIKMEVAMQLFDDCRDVELIRSAGTEKLKEWRACGIDGIQERVFRWEGKKRIETIGR